MPTLFSDADYKYMLERINRLTPAAQRNWGKMSVSQMLKHMSLAFAVPANKVQLPKDKLYYLAANPVARYMMIHVMTRWPKNMATVDAFKIKEDPAFEAAKNEMLANLHDFRKAAALPGRHPAFGVMSKALWGKAMYIHLDHHLTQFGV
jgi:hypothetical protein